MPRPLVVVSCVIEQDNTLLMGKRIDKGENGQWCFPGGKVEEGETLTQAATRELKEETNLTVFPHQWRFVAFTEPNGKLIMFLHTFQFFGKLKCLDKNFESWDWVPRSDWPAPCVHGAELFREIWSSTCPIGKPLVPMLTHH